MRSAQLDLLDHLTKNVGVEYDPKLAREIINQVAREVPGPAEETWIERFELVCREFGLRVRPVKATIRQALEQIRPGAPVVAYAPDSSTTVPAGGAESSSTGDGADGSAEQGRWYLLTDRRGRKTRATGLGKGEKDEWIRDKDLALKLGASGTDGQVTFAFVQSAIPCHSMRGPEAGSEHDEHHDHSAASHTSVHGHVRRLTPFRRLIGLVQPEWSDIATVIGFSMVVGVLYLGTPIAIEALVQMVAFGGLVQPVIILSLILLTVLGLAAMILAFQTYVVEMLQRRIFAKVVADLSYRLPRVQLEAFDRQNAPELVNRFFDVVTVQKAASVLLLDGLGIAIQALIGMAVLAFYHPFLLGYDIVLASLIIFALFVLGRGAVTTSVRESWAKYAVADWLEELARHPTTFRVSGGNDYALERADGLTQLYLRARSAHFRVVMRQIIFALALQAVASTSLLALGGWLVVDGQMTLGQLIAAELIVTVVVGSFAKVGKQLETYYDLLAGLEKLGLLIDLPLERKGGEGHRNLGTGAGLRLIGASYSYDHAHEVLSNVSLSVAPGEWVAIVGPSGSGKSTLVDMLFGLRIPTGGAIELDAADLRDIRLDSLRDHVAIVKGFEIVAGTIADNVRMGRDRISLADIREALDAVELLDDVRALPDGLHTRLTPNGAPLSQGQARRLMLARALAGRPRLLVVDELLDSLDADVRPKVFETIFDRTATRTLIVITHQHDIARRCDRTFRLDHGTIEEMPLLSSDDLFGWKVG